MRRRQGGGEIPTRRASARLVMRPLACSSCRMRRSIRSSLGPRMRNSVSLRDGRIGISAPPRNFVAQVHKRSPAIDNPCRRRSDRPPISHQEGRVAKFRIATPAGASFTVAGGGYGYELEALTPIEAEIYEIPPGSEDEFVAAAKDADALYAKGRPITKRMIDGLNRCKIIALGSVGVDSVDVEAATAKGIPVTNCPDTFIEEMVMTERGVEPVSLPELLARADIISMHSPATASAQRMIREEHFRQMKQTAIYISTGRGPTTDEAALIKALDEGLIAAAGLDVLEKEPPGDNNPLLRMDNVILTAHVASASARFDPARRRRVGLELSLALSGKWPMSCVNPSVLTVSSLKRWQPVSMERGPNS